MYLFFSYFVRVELCLRTPNRRMWLNLQAAAWLCLTNILNSLPVISVTSSSFLSGFSSPCSNCTLTCCYFSTLFSQNGLCGNQSMVRFKPDSHSATWFSLPGLSPVEALLVISHLSTGGFWTRWPSLSELASLSHTWNFTDTIFVTLVLWSDRQWHGEPPRVPFRPLGPFDHPSPSVRVRVPGDPGLFCACVRQC